MNWTTLKSAEGVYRSAIGKALPLGNMKIVQSENPEDRYAHLMFLPPHPGVSLEKVALCLKAIHPTEPWPNQKIYSQLLEEVTITAKELMEYSDDEIESLMILHNLV